MEDRKQWALEFLRKQVKDLESLLGHATTAAANAVLAKERFQKWKKQILATIAEKIGETYAKELSTPWLETTFAGGDITEELSDDIEMCLRHLRKLIKDIETQGLVSEKPEDVIRKE